MILLLGVIKSDKKQYQFQSLRHSQQDEFSLNRSQNSQLSSSLYQKNNYSLKGVNQAQFGQSILSKLYSSQKTANKTQLKRDNSKIYKAAYPVYQENKQFFHDLTSIPLVSEKIQIDKDIINEAVYGEKWRDKINKSALQSGRRSTCGHNRVSSYNGNFMPEIVPASGRIQKVSKVKYQLNGIKKNLNELSSLFVSSDEDNDEYDKDKTLRNGKMSRSIIDERTTQNSTLYGNNNNNLQVQSKFRKNRLDQSHLILKSEYLIQEESQNDSLLNKKDLNNSFNGLSQSGLINDRYQMNTKKTFDYSKRKCEQAIFDYYRNFKNLKASIEREEHLINPQAAYIQSCEQNKLIPRPYDMVNYKGDEEELSVENFQMGNKYAKSYGKGLQLMNVKKINMASNRLNEVGTLQILKGINKNVVQELDLSNNRVGIEAIEYLGGLIMKGEEGFQLKVLKIENSNINDMTLISLIESLDKAEKSFLTELNLARNQITDLGTERIANFLNKNPSLRNLNLHWNKIKIKGGIKIAESLLNNSNLKILDLSWNAFGKVNQVNAGYLSVSEVKQKLKGRQFTGQNEAIQQINEIETQQFEEKVGKAWGKALKYNKSLLHLDLSYNCFVLKSCLKIQSKIMTNHSLFGLHMAGNACTVDSHGFILIDFPESQQQQPNEIISPQTQQKGLSPSNRKQMTSSVPRSMKESTLSEIVSRSPQKEVLFKRMNGAKAVIQNRGKPASGNTQRSTMQTPKSLQKRMSVNYQETFNKNSSILSTSPFLQQPGNTLQKFKVKDNCWICEGWSEFKFELRVPQFVGAEVYLHFDFDEYKPDLMVSINAGIYQTHRMVPPGIHQYFFSINGQEYAINNGNTNQIQINDKTVTLIDKKLQRNMQSKYQKEFTLTKLNFVDSQFQKDQFGNGSDLYSVVRIKNCVPRPDKKFTAQKEDRPRTPWTFPISLFKEYKPEVPQLVNDCFEFDWQCLKKPKLKKSNEDDLKEKIREIYPFIREIYKRLAAFGVVGTVFSIGWNVYREFMISTINITDPVKLKPDDCDRLFIGVNAGNMKKSPFIPEKALVRFQLVEILLRAAIKKYFESGDVEGELEAFEMIIKQNLMPLKEASDIANPYMYNQQRWRQERYWNEPCDNIYKAFSSLFTFIYNTFGGTHKKPGQKTFMTLDEFDNLIQSSGLINDLMNARDIALHFNSAMMLQINEIDQERHLQATYIEFLEAFARVCDQASIVLNTQQDQSENENEYMMTEEERVSMPLHVKIENAIQYLLKNCTNKSFLDKFDTPKKHPQVGLYILPNKKFF